MKKSSIEWLVEQLGIKKDGWNNSVIKQAKEMRKEEMINFAIDYDEYCHNSFVQNQYKSIKSAEQYYENTYETTT